MKLESLALLRKFMPASEHNALVNNASGEEGPYFHDLIDSTADLIAAMPKTYEQEGKGDEAIVHLHYFHPAGDWYITEKDSEAVQHQAFGFACLNDWQSAELGYISIVELIQNGVELDLYWTKQTLGEVKAKLKVRLG
jgi:hypothetical protein